MFPNLLVMLKILIVGLNARVHRGFCNFMFLKTIKCYKAQLHRSRIFVPQEKFYSIDKIYWIVLYTFQSLNNRNIWNIFYDLYIEHKYIPKSLQLRMSNILVLAAHDNTGASLEKSIQDRPENWYNVPAITIMNIVTL